MAGELYTQMVIKIKGILVADNQEMTVEWEDTATDVDTVVKGAAGVSPGPQKCQITGTDAMSVDGQEVDLVDLQLSYTAVPVVAQQIGSNKKIAGDFIVRSNTFSGGVGAATTAAWTMKSVGVVPRPE